MQAVAVDVIFVARVTKMMMIIMNPTTEPEELITIIILTRKCGNCDALQLESARRRASHCPL